MSSGYWKKREAKALKKYAKDEAEYDKQIKKIYENQIRAIENEINAFYVKYANKEGITIQEAKKRVTQLDIKEYEKKAKSYVELASKDRKKGGKTNANIYFSDKANEEMALYNLTMKINRLEMLKARIGLEMVKGHAELETMFDEILTQRASDEFERQEGILGKTVSNNEKQASIIANASFHNATFSDRIWMYQDILKNDLSRLLQSGLIQGKNPRVLARDIRKKFDVSVSNAERLMRTELARVQIEAQKQSYEKNGFEKYEFIANSNCCDICSGLNGKIFDVEKLMPGENAPPMHPNCRCSTAPYEDREDYDEWVQALKNGTQITYADFMELKNSSKSFVNKETSVIIKLVDINKMITPYERKVLDAVKKKEGYFDVAAHGASNIICYGSTDTKISARELARIIRHDQSYQGEKIRLLSCSTGSTDDGFAQQLANALGVEVEAPTDILYIFPNGRLKIGIKGNGKMRKFKPFKRK